MKKNIYYFFLFFTASICCVSCGVKGRQEIGMETPLATEELQKNSEEPPTVDTGAAEASEKEAPCLIVDKDNNLVGNRRCSQMEKMNINETNFSVKGFLTDFQYKIESSAFQNCPNLKEIIFGNAEHVAWIADDAFQDCNSDLTVYCEKGTYLQKRVQELGVKWKAYTDEIHEENKNNKEAGFFIMNEQNVLVGYGDSIIDKKMYLPSETVKIYDGVFSHCYDIKEITIPENVTEIDNYAFSDSGLTKVHFTGNKLKKIGKTAFSGTMLKNVTIPEGVEWIEDYAFFMVPTKNLKFPKSVKKIGENVFIKWGKDNTIWVYKGSAADKYFAKEDFNVKYRD